MHNLISLHDATVAHRDELPPVLHEVSLDVQRGDWIAVAGDNGSGKTTLLATLGGVLPLRSGTQERTSGVRVALLLQDPDDQLVASSVEHELALSVPRDVDDATRCARIAAAIERFDLGALLDRNPHRLSGGEKQRLALATVWLESPDVLLLDEPLSFLDDEMRTCVIAFVREMNAEGVAVIWNTPGGDDVALARTAIVLANGRIAYAGDGAQIAARLDDESARAVEGALDDMAATTTRRAGDAWRAERVRIESVAFAYDRRVVLENLDLQVLAGERAAVTGRNGSGKSTLLLLAGGALAPSSGRITRSLREHGVVYLPQSPERLFFAETVMEELCFGLERSGIKRDEAHRRAADALNRVGLEAGAFAPRSPFELSFGEMRRVAFAIAWSLDPELLLLDEPLSCLDARGSAVLGRLTANAAQRGAAVMIASHGPTSALHCDRLLELRDHTLPGPPPAHNRMD
jgi:energy-coupling factor transporter ATP-binding protein EcfA2